MADFLTPHKEIEMIGKGTQRTIPLDLLGAIAGALAAAGNAPKTLAEVRALIGQDWIEPAPAEKTP